MLGSDEVQRRGSALKVASATTQNASSMAENQFKANGMRLPATGMESEIMLVMMEGKVEEDGVLDAREGESAQGSFGGETENPLSGREWIQNHWSEVASCSEGR